MTARRSPIFRNSDAESRAVERAFSTGDPQAALRLASTLSRAGSDGRIRLYRAFASAGIRYPDPAFLLALSGDERMLCCVSAMQGRNYRWTERVADFGLQNSPHSIEVVYTDSRHLLSRPDRPSNQDQYLGREGLEKARAEAISIEAPWAELVRTTINHTGSDGFTENTTFLTPTGYAQKTVYFHGGSDNTRPGVIVWDYDVREGFLPDARDPVEVARNLDLSFVSVMHALELRVQGLIDDTSNYHAQAPQEHVPGLLVERAGRRWREANPKILVHEEQACGFYNSPNGMCLVVIPPATGVPHVTIGIAGRVIGRRVRPNPAHFWPELAPWPPTPIGLRQPDYDDVAVAERALEERARRLGSPALVRRLAAWAATDARNKIKVDGNLALVWSEWNQSVRERLAEMRRVRRAARL